MTLLEKIQEIKAQAKAATEGGVGYKWPLNLKQKPISWVYQEGTMAAIYDSNDNLVAIVPQAQAEYVFVRLNSLPNLCEKLCDVINYLWDIVKEERPTDYLAIDEEVQSILEQE